LRSAYVGFAFAASKRPNAGSESKIFGAFASGKMSGPRFASQLAPTPPACARSIAQSNSYKILLQNYILLTTL
jgi:hypothetical protein